MAANYEFGPRKRVTMLYIDVLVNNIPIQAFVDSGGQSTVMTKECAEGLGLMRLVDTRCHGKAFGIGETKILGKIHVCELTILNKVLLEFPNSLLQRRESES